MSDRRADRVSIRTKVELFIAGALLVGIALVGLSMIKGGFSARDQPGTVEEFIARGMRRLAVPRDAREMKNPLELSEELLAEAREHFADHCASCHGNNGRGRTTMGRNLYPKAPDMQQEPTQSLSDGEIFYIIHNGIRLTGMPAWGEEPSEEDMESWKLVHFVRQLAKLTPAELEEMESMNPMSRRQFEEELEIEEFLKGGVDDAPPPEQRY